MRRDVNDDVGCFEDSRLQETGSKANLAMGVDEEIGWCEFAIW